MTIAIVHEIFFPVTNGVLSSSIAVARELQRRGHRVVFIAPAWRRFRGAEVEGISVEYVASIPGGIYPGIRLTWPFSRRAAQVLRRCGVDVLQLTAQGTLSWSCMRAARRLGLPVVSSLHTLIFEPEYVQYAVRRLGALNTERMMARLQRRAWALVCWFLQHSDIVTAPSRYACRLIEDNCPGVRAVHLPNCVAVEWACAGTEGDLRPAARGETEARGGPAAGKTFVYVGRLGKEKSVEVLLEGFYRAWRRDRQLRLVVVGDGPQATACRRLAESLWAGSGEVLGRASAESRAPAAVRFTGRLAHRELLEGGLLRGARALVTASTSENQPVSVLEAISLGRPVIVPDVPGINELVDGNGSLFAAGDAEALAAELLRMAGDDEFFTGCAARAREMGRAFCAGRTAGRYVRMYAALMGRARLEGVEGAGGEPLEWLQVAGIDSETAVYD